MIQTVQLDSDCYRKNSTIQTNLAQDPISRLMLRGDEAILDVGCGDGRLTSQLASLAPNGQVLGIDPSKTMIDDASRDWCAKHGNIQFQLRSGEQVYETMCYDLITSFSSFHWVKDPASVLEQFHNALRPQGRLVILMYPIESIFWSPFYTVIDRPQWEACLQDSIRDSLLTSSEYEVALNAIGFDKVVKEVSHDTVSYVSVDLFKDYARGWLPCLIPQLNKGDQERFLEEVAEEACAHYQISDGSLKIPFTRLVLWAVKK